MKGAKATLEGEVGHFARVLFDVDLSKDPPDSLIVKKDGYCLFTNVHYEKLPNFHNNCFVVVRSLANCVRNHYRASNANACTTARRKVTVQDEFIPKSTSESEI